ncbi:E3 SUMO-protein ligase PIAS4 isoform X3 [Strigops habroptila]|uniref:E3 SUMO-protein ligase PIAS4 isoform X3 n=1 Tax=Strigops habroptila TaxID=2489341 RepID=UPI0011CEE6E2|nr:E3 SUMO-protein ligase PIAS4 isoform X3 [Strigops habroptila]
MAAELVEAKNMVMSFRVSDLQMLLGFVGRSKSGLKHELVTRALQLVQFDCSPEVFKKIKELYETRYNKRSSEAAQPQPQQHRSAEALSIHSSYDRGSTIPRTTITTTNIDYPALYGKYLNGLGRLPPKVAKPEVRLVKLPFYTTLDELLKPTELVSFFPSPVPQNNEKLQESPCIFALTPRQVELIRNSRELQPGVKSVQVVLRICYTDTSSPQEDQYPPNIAVKVNHSYCSVPGYYPSNKPGVEPKRPCRPINLTHLMYLSAATNRITVTWGNYGKSYSVGLYLVRQMTSAELLQRLKTIGIKHPELCKALVKEKLRLDPDSEIATTGVRVSLICPLVKMRLSVPCRAETCAHLQCFDAVFYLQMNEKKPTWMCPVCDKPAPYDQLIIDGPGGWSPRCRLQSELGWQQGPPEASQTAGNDACQLQKYGFSREEHNKLPGFCPRVKGETRSELKPIEISTHPPEEAALPQNSASLVSRLGPLTPTVVQPSREQP